MRLHNFKLEFTPAVDGYNSRGTKPVTYTSYIYRVRDRQTALRIWKATQMPLLRKNGLRKWANTPVKITRVTKSGVPR